MLHRSTLGARRVDRAVETLFHQSRNPAAVVEMRVCEDHRVNRFGWDRQILPVALAPLLLTLKESAIDQYLQRPSAIVVDVHQMLRSRNHACRA